MIGFGKRRLVLYNPMHVFGATGQDTFIANNIKHVKEQLAQVPEGKRGALVITTELKWGVVPDVRLGWAQRIGKGWEISGDGFIGKMDKGVRAKVVKAW